MTAATRHGDCLECDPFRPSLRVCGVCGLGQRTSSAERDVCSHRTRTRCSSPRAHLCITVARWRQLALIQSEQRGINRPWWSAVPMRHGIPSYVSTAPAVNCPVPGQMWHGYAQPSPSAVTGVRALSLACFPKSALVAQACSRCG